MFQRVLSASLAASVLLGTPFILTSTEQVGARAQAIGPVDLQREFNQLVLRISFQEGINPGYGSFGELLQDLLEIPYDSELTVQVGEITIRTKTYYLGEAKKVCVDYYCPPDGEKIARLCARDTSDPPVLREISLRFNNLADPRSFPEFIRLQDFEGGRGLMEAEIQSFSRGAGKEALYLFQRRNGLPIPQAGFFDDEGRIDWISSVRMERRRSSSTSHWRTGPAIPRSAMCCSTTPAERCE